VIRGFWQISGTPAKGPLDVFGRPLIDGIADAVISRNGSGHGFITVWTVSVD
jgi:hypothetical protein